MAPGAAPEPEMEHQVTEARLTFGSIQEAAGVLELEDLQRVYSYFAYISSGEPLSVPDFNSEEALRDVIIERAEFLQERDPIKLEKIAEFVHGAARERFKTNLTKYRKTANR